MAVVVIEDLEVKSRRSKRRMEIDKAAVIPVNKQAIESFVSRENLSAIPADKREASFVKVLTEISLHIGALDGVIEDSKKTDRALTEVLEAKSTEYKQRETVRAAKRKAIEDKKFLYRHKNELKKIAKTLGFKLSDNKMLSNFKAVEAKAEQE